MISFVLWYSMVPFQCRSVWKVICSSLGFPSFRTAVFRVPNNSRANWFPVDGRLGSLDGNIHWLFFGRRSNALMRSFDTCNILGLLPFSGLLILRFLFSLSMSIHLSFTISPIRAPVSFAIRRAALVRLPEWAIRSFISCSVGINGSLDRCTYLGFFQVRSPVFKNVVYAAVAKALLESSHALTFASTSLTVSGCLGLAPCFMRVLNQYTYTSIVFSL